MEAGINPTSSSVDSVKLVELALDLTEQCITLCTIAKYTQSRAESNSTHMLLHTILSYINIITCHLSTAGSVAVYSSLNEGVIQSLHSRLLFFNNTLWNQLAFPHVATTRKIIFSILQAHQKVYYYLYHNNPAGCQDTHWLYFSPAISALPSVETQVVHNPHRIIDPYQVALQKNYYYPLLSTMMEDTMDKNIIDSTSTTSTSNERPRPEGGGGWW